MILLRSRRHVFINIFVFYIIFSSLLGESRTHDISEVPDGFKLNTEEILRRRKLVEPYILQIAEKQSGWLETNHLSVGSNEIHSMRKAVSESQILEKSLVHGDIFPTESIQKIPVQKPSKEDKIKSVSPGRLTVHVSYSSQIKSQHLNVDYNRQESIDTEERARRHSIVEDFLPELKALEKGIGIDQVSPKKQKYNGNKKDISNIEEPQSVESSNEAVSEGQFSRETGIFNKPSTVERMSGAVNAVHYCVVGDMKESFLHIIKKETESKDNDLPSHKAPLFEKRNSETNNPVVKSIAEKNIQVEFKKNVHATVKLYSVSEKHLERLKLVEPYLLSLNQEKKNWIETHHFSYKETDTGVIHSRHFAPYDREVVKIVPNILEQGQIQERLFFQRWLIKLLNKFADYPFTEHLSISFNITADSLNNLKMLSEFWNIKNADQLISGLISNANVHYTSVSDIYHSFTPLTLYIIFSITTCVLLYFLFLYHPFAKILVFFVVCIAWHGFKMYQEKVAAKHATVSGSSPDYCESILNKESGIFAHVKEFFRHAVYKDHCEKYYEALMINPLAELSVPIVVSDFVSTTFFQVFRPMGRMLNTLVKDLFRDLSFVQAFYLILLLIFIFVLFFMFTLVYNRYKLNLPFFMGSVEPSVASGGSRVEDLTIKLSIKEDSPLKVTVSKENIDLQILHNKKPNVSPKIPQNDCDYKISKPLVRRYSF